MKIIHHGPFKKRKEKEKKKKKKERKKERKNKINKNKNKKNSLYVVKNVWSLILRYSKHTHYETILQILDQ